MNGKGTLVTALAPPARLTEAVPGDRVAIRSVLTGADLGAVPAEPAFRAPRLALGALPASKGGPAQSEQGKAMSLVPGQAEALPCHAVALGPVATAADGLAAHAILSEWAH